MALLIEILFTFWQFYSVLKYREIISVFGHCVTKRLKIYMSRNEELMKINTSSLLILDHSLLLKIIKQITYENEKAAAHRR